jgi:hypothetical protein
MDPHILSSLPQSLASRTTRRTTLAGLGGCGLAAGLLGALGLRGTGAALAESSIERGSADPALISPLTAAQGSIPAWRLAGDAMEACRCAVTCPCNFASDPTEIPCNSIIGWHIAKGQYGDIALDDLNLIAYLQIPANAFAGGWTLGYYIDERATPPQFEALGAIFGGQAGGWPAVLGGLIATPIAPKQAPITYELADGEVRVAIPGVLEIGTEHVPHPMPGLPPLDLKVSNLAVPFYTGSADVRRSTILKFTDPDLSFEYLGRSALIGTFEYEGP